MKLAIVTGGSRGLGLALCEALEERGYRLLEFSRSAPHRYSVEVDLGDPLASREIIARAVQPFVDESLDEILVFNNAGTLSPMGPVAAKPPEDVRENLDVNLVGGILGLAGIISAFQGTPCRKVISQISSGAAQYGYAGWSLYCAAKAGMENFIRSVALEQERQENPFVAININPGVMDTEMQSAIREASEDDFPEVDRFVRRHETGELADPADIAERIMRIVTSRTIQGGDRYDVADFA